MDIVQVLREDHDELRQLVKKCSFSRSPANREKYFVELKQAFEMHSFIEPLIFYPALLEAGIDPAHVRARQEEIVRLMAELDSVTPEDESWLPAFRTIKKRIEGYLAEEEEDVLPLSREKLDPDVLEKLGAQMVAKTAEQRAVQ